MLPSDRVRSLAEIITRTWEKFTDDEKLDLLAMINSTRELIADERTVKIMLARMDGNISEAARALGIARRTMQNRMRAFNMPTGKHGRRSK